MIVRSAVCGYDAGLHFVFSALRRDTAVKGKATVRLVRQPKIVSHGTGRLF